MKDSRRAVASRSLFILGVMSVAAALLSSVAVSGVLSQDTRKKIVDEVLRNGFWGHAYLSDGRLAQPSAESEREVSPLTVRQADRAIDVGELTAIGVWCTIDWKPFYLAYTKSLRGEGLTETQVAFAGVLHGVSQASVFKSLEKRGRCSDQLRESTRQRLQTPPTKSADSPKVNS